MTAQKDAPQFNSNVMQKNKFTKSLNKPISELLAAGLIILAVISIAVYLFLSTDFSQVSISPGIFIIPVALTV